MKEDKDNVWSNFPMFLLTSENRNFLYNCFLLWKFFPNTSYTIFLWTQHHVLLKIIKIVLWRIWKLWLLSLQQQKLRKLKIKNFLETIAEFRCETNHNPQIQRDRHVQRSHSKLFWPGTELLLRIHNNFWWISADYMQTRVKVIFWSGGTVLEGNVNI